MQRTRAVRSPDVSSADRRIEDIHLRNYDFERAYDLRIAVYDGDEAVLARRFYARPGWSRSLDDRLPAGEYEVVAVLDDEARKRERCRIDDDPEHSVLIECGNGCVSIAEGVY